MRVTLALALLLLLGVSAAADPRQDTDVAIAELRVADREMTAATATRTALSTRYEAELRAIDRLKKQRGSWRRDRQLRESLAASLETAKKLERATALLKRSAQRLEQARSRTLAVVTAELRGEVAPPRMAVLTRERARLVPPTPATKKIVLPELEIDPLADPEELEQQAAAIRQSEAALAAQVATLDHRTERLREVAELRRQHARASDLSERDDGPTRRGAVRDEGRGVTDDASDAPSPGPDSTPGEGATGGGGQPEPGFVRQLSDDVSALAESRLVLGDVLDAAALESLRSAQASSDPAVRAAAAKRARDAAAAKLAQLRKQRAAIEARARALRSSTR